MGRWAAPLLAALIVGGAAAMALMVAGAIGLGQATEAPARRVGDRAMYTVRDENGTLLGELRVEALAPFAARTADGSWQAVEALRQAFVPDGGRESESIVEPWHAADGPVVAVRFAGGNQTYVTWTNRYNDVAVGVAIDEERPHNVFVAPQAVLYDGVPAGEGGWCGLRHSAQGDPVDVRDGIDAPDCPTGRLDWVGRVADGVHLFGAGADRVWVAKDWTYPVRIETGRTDGLRVLELTGFQAGAVPVDPAGLQLPARGDVPAIQFSPRTSTGPDAAGVDHPFPIESAFEHARAAADRPLVSFSDRGLGRFLKDHPDAQVVEAHYSEHTDTDWTLLTWQLALVDGDAWASGSVSLEQREPEASPLAPPAWSGLSPLRGNAVVSADGPAGPWPHESLWPAQMPTVRSVMDRWQAVRDPLFQDDAPTGWSFRIGCADEACSAAAVEVGAGHVRFQQPPDPFVQGPVGLPQGGTVSADSQELVVDGEGDSRALRSVHRREAPTDNSLIAVPGAATSSVATQPAPAWELPPAAAATTGALALVAALAALLWPTLKSGAGAGATGAAGLFSRIEHDRLLDHPGRASIVHAIEADPGVHLQELGRRTGIATGALRHHLGKLQAAGLVVSRPLNGYLCYFAPAAARAPAALASAVARSEGARKVLEAMQGGATGVREIAAITGLAPSTVSHHLARLREVGSANAAEA